MTPMPRNQRLALRLLAVVAVMVGMSYAAVPLYSLFCKVTGYGGTTNVAAAPSGAVLDRTVEIRFDSNTAPGMPWVFRPVERIMKLRIGETALAYFEAYNPTDTRIAGTATYNVAPYAAGSYFTKIDCFCFTMQVLEPGERVEMPVTFFVDPEIVDDLDTRHVREITLSYTMHRAEVPADQQSAAATDARVAEAPTGPATRVEQ
jgi:cytochrome c oxidase assembly protein subunit 11